MAFGRREAASLLREFGVLDHPEVGDQRPEHVTVALAKRRAVIYQRDPSLLDGLFGGWLMCWPGFPQHSSYSRFMARARKQLFSGVSPAQAERRAVQFCTAEALGLQLPELLCIVFTENVLEKEGGKRRVQLFNVGLLDESSIPKLGGYVYLPPRETETRRTLDVGFSLAQQQQIDSQLSAKA